MYTKIGAFSRRISIFLLLSTIIYICYSMVGIYTGLCNKFYENVKKYTVLLDEEINTRVKSISYIAENQFKPRVEEILKKNDFSEMNLLLKDIKKKFPLNSDIGDLFIVDENYYVKSCSNPKKMENIKRLSHRDIDELKKIKLENKKSFLYNIIRSYEDPEKWVQPIVYFLNSNDCQEQYYFIVTVNLTTLGNFIKSSNKISPLKDFHFFNHEEHIDGVSLENFERTPYKQVFMKILLNYEYDDLIVKFTSKATGKDIFLIYDRKQIALKFYERLFSSFFLSLLIAIIIYVVYVLYKKYVLEQIIYLYKTFDKLQNRIEYHDNIMTNRNPLFFNENRELGDVTKIALIGDNLVKKVEELNIALDRKSNAIQKMAIQGSLVLSNLKANSELLSENQEDLFLELNESNKICKHCNLANHLKDLVKEGKINSDNIDMYNQVLFNSIKWLLEQKKKVNLKSLIDEIILEERINPREVDIFNNVIKLSEVVVLPEAFKETIKLCMLYFLEHIKFDVKLKLSASMAGNKNLRINFSIDKSFEVHNECKHLFQKIKMYAILNNGIFEALYENSNQSFVLHFNTKSHF